MKGFAVIASCVMSGLSLAQLPTLSYRQIWPEASFPNGQIPLEVEVANQGPDTMGTLRVQSRFGQTIYPVELPKGSQKVLKVYLESGGGWYGESRLELSTGNGNARAEIEIKSGPSQNATYVGLIGDSPGLLSSLRTGPQKDGRFWDTTCKPEDAPDRSIGYLGLSLLILHDGAERLPDSSVAAIQRFVLAGGHLLMTGGPSAPWLRDPRWQSIMPAKPGAATVVTVPSFRPIGGPASPMQLSVVRSTLVKGASAQLGVSDIPIVSERQIGFGKVVYWAFDPFADPLRTSPTRNLIIRNVSGKANRISEYLGRGDRYSNRFRGIPGTVSTSDNPFQTEMPPPGQIALILFGFLLTVIPVNFFVLNKLGRREWAWTTIPLISVAFSAGIFATASSLYKSDAAHQTDGVAIVHDGLDQGIFTGTQAIFLPRAGRYNLGFQGVESATNAEEDFSMFAGPSVLGAAPDMIDIGEVVAPQLEASNLTFRQLFLVQRIPMDGRILFTPTIRRTREGWKITGNLQNKSPLNLKSVSLGYQGFACELPDLKAGQTLALSATIVHGNLQPWRNRPAPPTGDCLVLMARTDEMQIGTQLGKEPSSSPGCRLIYTWDKP